MGPSFCPRIITDIFGISFWYPHMNLVNKIFTISWQRGLSSCLFYFSIKREKGDDPLFRTLQLQVNSQSEELSLKWRDPAVHVNVLIHTPYLCMFWILSAFTNAFNIIKVFSTNDPCDLFDSFFIFICTSKCIGAPSNDDIVNLLRYLPQKHIVTTSDG